MTIVIVDYGMGNLGSIANMLRKIGAHSEVSGDPDRIATAESLVLPGVGAFDVAMDTLRASGLIEPLERQVRDRGVPLLGICLGMQLLATSSEEGTSAGLDWIPGRVARLPTEGPDGPVRIPHMGWSTVAAAKPASRLPALGTGEARYYFVHSYAFGCDDPNDVLGESSYGCPFTSAVERDNVVGVQFHPEKSHRHGLALLADFAGL